MTERTRYQLPNLKSSEHVRVLVRVRSVTLASLLEYEYKYFLIP